MSNCAGALVIEGSLISQVDQSLPNIACLESLSSEFLIGGIEDFIKDGNGLELQKVVPGVHLQKVRDLSKEVCLDYSHQKLFLVQFD